MNSTLCCSNDQYCIVNATWGVQCCALDSTCGVDCPANFYLTNITKIVTETVTVESVTASATTTTTSVATEITTLSACTERKCSSTNYLCASSFGAGCCPYGFNCASSGQCIGMVSSASSSSSISALVSPVPSGCSVQGQTLCTAGAGISGSGCCDAGFACVTYSASLMCSETTASSSSVAATATAPGNVTVEHKDGSLSTGAKAGIAVGVIALAAVLIGGLTWLCIRRRRRAGRGGRSGQSTTTRNEMRSIPPNDGEIPGERIGGGGGRRPQQNVSESGYVPSLTQYSRDYYSGPYTDHVALDRDGANDNTNDDINNHTWESAAATMGTPAREQFEQRETTRREPDDVSVPVEMGSDISNSRPRGYSQAGSSDGGHSELADTSAAATAAAARNGSSRRVRDSIARRFELYGNDRAGATGGSILPQPLPTPGSEMSEFGTPSPMSRDEDHPKRGSIM